MLNGFLSSEQARVAREQFLAEGYLVVPDVVPLALCQTVIDAISEYQDAWRGKNVGGHGIIPVHHHQSFWDVRQHPPVYEVFRAIYDRPDLWVTMDRASYKPPAGDSRLQTLSPVHWDCDPYTFDGLRIQGLVYLTDTRADQGAFTCVPSIYKNLKEYLRVHASDQDPRRPEVSEDQLLAVEGGAGSLVLFHRLMPHTSGINRSTEDRYVQYVAMEPTGSGAERQTREKEWREKLPPAWAIRQKIVGQSIPEAGDPAVLTKLGQKLVGTTAW